MGRNTPEPARGGVGPGPQGWLTPEFQAKFRQLPWAESLTLLGAGGAVVVAAHAVGVGKPVDALGLSALGYQGGTALPGGGERLAAAGAAPKCAEPPT